MEAITELLRSFSNFTAQHGVFQTTVLVVIVGYIVRDWWIRKQNSGLFDALVDNNKIMTSLFEKQVGISERASQAASISASELSRQTGKLEDLVDLTTKGNAAIHKLADSFGSDPLKMCKVDDETIIAKFAAEWQMPSEKVREWIMHIKATKALP